LVDAIQIAVRIAIAIKKTTLKNVVNDLGAIFGTSSFIMPYHLPLREWQVQQKCE